ncbi:MAG: archaellin/type IV pilin N-terminal domain-containing protein [Acidilobaceae archaeon]
MRKGISPVIATVILIAVAIAVAIAVGAWVMGIWGGLGGGERLVISYARLYGNNAGGTLELRVKNDGTAVAKIVRIEVVGAGAWPVGANCSIIDTTGGRTETKGLIKVEAGESTTIKCTFSGNFTVGERRIIKIFTEAGSEYTIERTVEQGSATQSQGSATPPEQQGQGGGQ